MWLPGHLAVSFLACTPVLLYSRKHGEDWTLALSYVAFFAVLPDFLHIDELRIVSHSLFGLVALVSMALVVLSLFFEVRKSQVLIASVAAGAHLFADWMFGHFFPLFPLSQEYESLNTFNTYLDIRVEIAFSAIAIVVFVAFMIPRRATQKPVLAGKKDIWNFLVLLLPFLAIALLETIYFVQNMMTVGVTFTRLVLLSLFVIPVGGTLIAIKGLFER